MESSSLFICHVIFIKIIQKQYIHSIESRTKTQIWIWWENKKKNKNENKTRLRLYKFSSMTSQEDPYKSLTQSIKALKKPLETLMKNHDEFLLQNVQIMNNVNSLPKFNLDLQEELGNKQRRWFNRSNAYNVTNVTSSEVWKRLSFPVVEIKIEHCLSITNVHHNYFTKLIVARRYISYSNLL